MRKHLSPVWWMNPSRGGNKSRDFSQTYVERVPGSFAAQYSELQRVHPAMMQAALDAWGDWYVVAAEEKRSRASVEGGGGGGGGGGGSSGSVVDDGGAAAATAPPPLEPSRPPPDR